MSDLHVTANPWGVCVVPAASDPGGVLADGRCGGAPAVVASGALCAYESHRQWETERERGPIDCYMCRYPLRALPLWWAGELVPEGWDRFVRAVLTAAGGGDDRPVSRFPSLDEVLGAAPVAVQAGLASRVVVLDLVDGRVVERAP